MCLSSIQQIKSEKLPKDKYHIGWKCVYIDTQNKNKFTSLFNVSKLFDKWLKCNYKLTDRIRLYLGDIYPKGFHIFTTREDARNYKHKSRKEKVVKVRYRRVVARGMQSDYKCVIAKEIYVESPQ